MLVSLASGRIQADLFRALTVKVWTVSRTLEAMFDKAKQRSPVADDASGEDWFEKLGKLAYDWQSRDWLLTSRMLVSNSFSKFIPDATRCVHLFFSLFTLRRVSDDLLPLYLPFLA